MWFLSNLSLEYVLVNPRKAICGVSYGKYKHLSKNQIKLFQNSLVILYSKKRWSIVSSAFLQNKHRGEDDFPKTKSFLFK